jgi:Fe(3+) dicitrate transport protein
MRARLYNIIAFICASCSFLGLGAGRPCSAQTGQIEGRVTEAQTGKALASVNVTLNGTDLRTATNSAGAFGFQRVPVGEYVIVIGRIGYETIEHAVAVKEGETQRLSVALSAKPIEFSGIVVERDMMIGDANRVAEIPGSAHFISEAELKKYGYNDINRILRQVPGVNIQEEDGYGLRPNIGMRGSGTERCEKISVMEDGVLIAPAPYAAPAAYYFPTVGRMTGIEVRKGSSQIKYGPHTTGGALNLISTPIPAAFAGDFNLIAGDNDTRTIHAGVGDSYKNFGFLAETYQAKADGFKQLDGGGNTGFDKKDYMLKLRVNTNHTARVYQELTFKLGQTEEISNETYLGLADADFAKTPYRRYTGSQRDQMNTEHRQLQARHFIVPSAFLDVTTTAYFNDFKRNWYKLDRARGQETAGLQSITNILNDPVRFADEYAILTGVTSAHNNALEVKANNRKYYSQGAQTIFGFRFNFAGLPHELEAGVRYHEDEEDRFQWADLYKMENGIMKLATAGTPGTESNRVGAATAWASFIQYKLVVGKFTASPGLRYENIRLKRDDYGTADPGRTGANLRTTENHVTVWIPGIGADYKFTPSFSALAGIHKGFAPPGFVEGARPEKSINYELGTRYRTNSLNLEGIVFYNDYDNLLGADLAAGGGQGTGDLFNGGRVEVKGLELSLSCTPELSSYAFPLRVAYTYTEAKFKSSFRSDFEPWGVVQDGFDLPYIPRHQLAISAALEAAMWSINLNAKYVSKMRTEAGTGDFISSQSTDEHFVMDAIAHYALTSNNTLFVGVQNLTDVTYIVARRPAGARPGLPRTFAAGIKTDF